LFSLNKRIEKAFGGGADPNLAKLSHSRLTVRADPA